MGTWIKETDIAIYLMQGGYWVSRITKYPSQSNPKEQVVNIGSIKSWFLRDDFPQAMTVSLGTGAPEPQPMPPPPPKPPTPPPPPPSPCSCPNISIVFRNPVAIPPSCRSVRPYAE